MILWDDRVMVADLNVSAMLHDSGSHLLTFAKYGGRFMDVGFHFTAFHFTAADIDALVALLERMRAARGGILVDPRDMEAC